MVAVENVKEPPLFTVTDAGAVPLGLPKALTSLLTVKFAPLPTIHVPA